MRQLFDNESTRQLRVNQTLLEADNDWLRLHLRTTDEETFKASETESKLKSELRDATREILVLQDSLRSSARRVEELRVSRTTLNNQSYSF